MIIQALPQKVNPAAGLYDVYMLALPELLAAYDNRQLALILEFMSRFSAITFQEAARLRASAESSK